MCNVHAILFTYSKLIYVLLIALCEHDVARLDTELFQMQQHSIIPYILLLTVRITLRNLITITASCLLTTTKWLNYCKSRSIHFTRKLVDFDITSKWIDSVWFIQVQHTEYLYFNCSFWTQIDINSWNSVHTQYRFPMDSHMLTMTHACKRIFCDKYSVKWEFEMRNQWQSVRFAQSYSWQSHRNNQMNYQNLDKSLFIQFTRDGAVVLLLTKIHFHVFDSFVFFSNIWIDFFLPANELLSWKIDLIRMVRISGGKNWKRKPFEKRKDFCLPRKNVWRVFQRCVQWFGMS